ncbi:hypothetical protein [Rahnella phage Sarma103]|nr:hypothetical protein [Rahnella phage Sarma103]
MKIKIHFTRDSMDSQDITVPSNWTLMDVSAYVSNNYCWVSYISFN